MTMMMILFTINFIFSPGKNVPLEKKAETMSHSFNYCFFRFPLFRSLETQNLEISREKNQASKIT